MRLEHNRICTWNSEVEVGNTYLFTEGNLEFKVKVVDSCPQREGIRLNLKVIDKPYTSPIALGEEFEVLAAWGYQDKGQWWYLHDADLVEY